MAQMFDLTVMMPDREFYHGFVTMVELNTTEGVVGIYGGHIPLTAAVAPGVLRIHEEKAIKEAALLSGFLEISHDRMVVLAERVEWPGDIDRKRAEDAKIRAERRIKDGGTAMDMVRAEMALKRALVRLEVK